MAAKLILLRHGQSEWNLENRFTGWTDVDLSERGMEEAREAGRRMAEAGIVVDVAFTSVLKRAVRTLWLALDEMDQMWVPVERSWLLNERHYGALQGLNKAETAEKYGEEQVHAWRRGYAVRPPALDADDPRHPRFDRRYAHVPADRLPATESLADTLARVAPYWRDVIAPRVRARRTTLIAAHGNSLRALVKRLDGTSDEEIRGLNIPTGIPLVYEMKEDLTVLDSHYLADPETLQAAVNEVAHQADAGKGE